jgi:hypothetical protein
MKVSHCLCDNKTSMKTLNEHKQQQQHELRTLTMAVMATSKRKKNVGISSEVNHSK